MCFTGKSRLKRAQLEKLAEDAGATVKKSVGKGLSFLVKIGRASWRERVWIRV